MNNVTEKTSLENKIIVVPGLLDSSLTYRISEKTIKENGRTPIYFKFDSKNKDNLEKKFSDEMDALIVFCKEQSSYEIFTFSHGFVVAGFCYKEKLIHPKRIVAVSPIISREDWLDIKNTLVPSWGPYLKDSLIKTSKVDFSNDNRKSLKGIAFDIPVVLIHGNRDEYFYNYEGKKIGKNNIDEIIQSNVEIKIIENMRHYPIDTSSYKQLIKCLSEIFVKE